MLKAKLGIVHQFIKKIGVKREFQKKNKQHFYELQLESKNCYQ